MSTSKISWTDFTWNFMGGCSPVSEGCQNCYAAKLASTRLKHRPLYRGLTKDGKWTGKIRLDEKRLNIPLHKRKPCKIFVQSMGDLFHPDVPFETVNELMAVFVLCPQHTGQILTKRPERMLEYFSEENKDSREDGMAGAMCNWIAGGGLSDDMLNEWCRKKGVSRAWRERLNDARIVWYNACYYHEARWPLPNLHLGVSVELPKYKSRMDILRQIPAAKRYISIEPCLGDMGKLDLTDIDWVIIGCESGPKRRPCRLEWVRALVRQCKAANTLVHIKQLDINGRVEHNVTKFPQDLQLREYLKGR